MEPIRNLISRGRCATLTSYTLNQKAIEALAARARSGDREQLELVDEREPGLRIRAGERTVTWSLLIRLRTGKRTRVTLGTWPGIGVAEARGLAQNRRREVALGLDPNEEGRIAVKAAVKFAASQRKLGEVLDQYEHTKLSQLRRGANARRAIDGKRGLLKTFVAKDISSITRSDLVEAVRKHALKAPIAANRCLAYTKAFLNWCVDQEIIENNPAATVKKPSKERTRDRFHTVDELVEIWTAMGELGYPFGPLFRLLVILPMRREEVAAMSMTELKLDPIGSPEDSVWTLPAARTKRANALRVPLSPQARSIIMEAIDASLRAENSPFVFSITGGTSVSGYAKAKRRLDKIIHDRRVAAAKTKERQAVEMEHWTIHDLRTTFSTLACEILDAEISVVDRILNHVATATTSKIMRVYNKSQLFERRKRVLREWADLVDQEAAKRSDQVVGANSTLENLSHLAAAS